MKLTSKTHLPRAAVVALICAMLLGGQAFAQVTAPTKPQGALIPKPEAPTVTIRSETMRMDTAEPSAVTFTPLVGMWTRWM